MGKGFNLSKSISSISGFKFALFDFSANLEVSTPVTSFKSSYVA